MYEYYKPLRNLMRTFSIEGSLAIIGECSHHIVADGPRPAIQGADGVDLRSSLYPYQLMLLCREILLHAVPQGTRTLANWNDFAAASNAIGKYADLVSPASPSNIQLELHRIAQQQLPLQKRLSVSRFMRYIHVYQHADVARIFERAIEIPVRDFAFLGFIAFSQFSKCARFVTSVDLTCLGISDIHRDRFFRRMTASVEELRVEFKKVQAFDHTWQYTFNALSDRPLINVDPLHPDRVYGPIPERVLTRFTESVFYLLHGQEGFATAFGKAFEAHIDAVIVRACASPSVVVYRESPFRLGKNIYHGVDFIISDSTGNVFVECKTKRLGLAGQIAVTQQELDNELEIAAGAIVQNYGNLDRALKGKSHWTPNGLPSVNVVVTLEDWNLLTPDSFSRLADKVAASLAAKGLGELLEKVPYVLTSSETFESACCAINLDSIAGVFGSSFSAPRGGWYLAASLQRDHRQANLKSQQLFIDEFKRYGEAFAGQFGS